MHVSRSDHANKFGWARNGTAGALHVASNTVFMYIVPLLFQAKISTKKRKKNGKSKAMSASASCFILSMQDVCTRKRSYPLSQSVTQSQTLHNYVHMRSLAVKYVFKSPLHQPLLWETYTCSFLHRSPFEMPRQQDKNPALMFWWVLKWTQLVWINCLAYPCFELDCIANLQCWVNDWYATCTSEILGSVPVATPCIALHRSLV